jgi:hypothetical protein
MKYLEIILQGYYNENNREYLDKYFFRELKKAEAENYEASEFFNGCLKVIERWEEQLKQKVYKRKSELFTMLSEAKNQTLKYHDLEGKTAKQKFKETIKYCEEELKDEKPDGIGSQTFTLSLFQLSGGRIGSILYLEDITTIKTAILEAKLKVMLQKVEDKIDADDKGKSKKVLRFEELLSGIDVAKIQPYLNKYHKAKPEDLAVLILALNNYGIKDISISRKYAAAKLSFEFKHSRQALNDQLNKYGSGIFDAQIRKVKSDLGLT